MKVFIKIVFLVLMGCNISSGQKKTDFSIVRFGAVGDGKTLNTAAIRKAIDAASRHGGGRVIIPRGVFLSGSILLKSNVDFYLEEGALLLGSTDPVHYKRVNKTNGPRSPKTDDYSSLAFLMAEKARNFSITGQGTIDGQGRELALHIDSLHHKGIKKDPEYNYRRMRPNETARPSLSGFSRCTNINISGVTLKNSAGWGVTFELCKDVVLDRITQINRAYWNNDGIDITDCENVRITNCNINAADDGICLKSYYPGFYNNNIHIANCTIRSSASAIKFGSASYGGFKNVTIDSIEVYDTFRSAIAIESVDGGIIENILVSNVVARNTGNAFFIRLGHRDGEQPGSVNNIHFKNIKAEVPFSRPDLDYDLRGPEVDFFHNPFPASVVGLDTHRIQGVKLENIEIIYPGRATRGMAYIPLWDLERVPEKVKDYPEFSMFGELPAWGLYVRHARNVTLKNIKFSLKEKDFRPAFVFDDVENLKIRKISVFGAGKNARLILKEVENAIFAEKDIQTKIIE